MLNSPDPKNERIFFAQKDTTENTKQLIATSWFNLSKAGSNVLLA
jgi:hypothetical protein